MTYYVNPPIGLPTTRFSPNDHTIGKCSKCGGTVIVPSSWMSVVPPIPQCTSCGAHKKSNLPTIEME